MNKSTLIVAELSANHQHNIEIAKKTTKAAKDSGADAIKLQTYTPDTLTIDCDNPYFTLSSGTIWDGITLYNLYKQAFTPWEWHKELKDYAESLGLVFFSTPFDRTSVDFLEELGVPFYKIASFEIVDIPLIKYVASKRKPMIISTGIADIDDIELALKTCRENGCEDITLLKCTSSYPAPIEAANILTIPDMRNRFGVNVGLSDHTMGSSVALGAVALGAVLVEKHFILDRSLGGPDAKFSMEPDEFKSMKDGIREIELALGGVSYKLTEKELLNKKFSKSIFIVKDIEEGELFSESNISVIRPGDGLHPKHFEYLLGKKCVTSLVRGTPMSMEYVAK